MHPHAKRLLSVAALVAAPGCSSNYHPEYHPVAVSNFSQNIAYPASSNGIAAMPPGTVYVVPAPQGAVAMPVPGAPVDAPPPEFFR